MNDRTKQFKDYIRKHEINGRVAAEILEINTSYLYQKISGAVKVMEDDLEKLKKGYKKYLLAKLKNLN